MNIYCESVSIIIGCTTNPKNVFNYWSLVIVTVLFKAPSCLGPDLIMKENPLYISQGHEVEGLSYEDTFPPSPCLNISEGKLSF